MVSVSKEGQRGGRGGKGDRGGWWVVRPAADVPEWSPITLTVGCTFSLLLIRPHGYPMPGLPGVVARVPVGCNLTFLVPVGVDIELSAMTFVGCHRLDFPLGHPWWRRFVHQITRREPDDHDKAFSLCLICGWESNGRVGFNTCRKHIASKHPTINQIIRHVYGDRHYLNVTPQGFLLTPAAVSATTPSVEVVTGRLSRPRVRYYCASDRQRLLWCLLQGAGQPALGLQAIPALPVPALPVPVEQQVSDGDGSQSWRRGEGGREEGREEVRKCLTRGEWMWLMNCCPDHGLRRPERRPSARRRCRAARPRRPRCCGE